MEESIVDLSTTLEMTRGVTLEMTSSVAMTRAERYGRD